MPSSPIAAVSDMLHGHVLDTATELTPATGRDRRDLAATLAVVPDPRRRRGVRHAFTPLLTPVVCAMLAGSRSLRRDRGTDRGPARHRARTSG